MLIRLYLSRNTLPFYDLTDPGCLTQARLGSLEVHWYLSFHYNCRTTYDAMKLLISLFCSYRIWGLLIQSRQTTEGPSWGSLSIYDEGGQDTLTPQTDGPGASQYVWPAFYMLVSDGPTLPDTSLKSVAG